MNKFVKWMNQPLIDSALRSAYCFFKKDYFYRASSLAFTTILAVVPLFIVVVFFMTFFPIFGDIIKLTETYLLENFAPSASLPIKNYFTIFVHQASSMPIGNIFFLFITAMMLINTVEETLNKLWGTTRHRKRMQALLFYWVVILITPLIIGFSIFLSSALLKTYWIARFTELLQLKFLIDFLLPILVNTLLFSLLYIAVPSVKVVWRYGLLGGFLAAVIFNLIRISFVWYIQQFPSYSLLYGVFAVIPIFMVWLYIAWIIIIWGALFTHYYQLSMRKLT